MAQDEGLYAAPPRQPLDISQCVFYHFMDLPQHGTVGQEWDLRGHEHEYLGHVELAGKRVLEIGPSSGCLTFFMDRSGADVVALDLSPEFPFELVPYAGTVWRSAQEQTKGANVFVNNGWWFARQAFGAHAQLAYGTAYDVPEALGLFDMATVCAVLLHLRDPFLALQSTCERSKRPSS